MARLIDATRIEQFILNNCSDNEEINTIYGELINAPTIDLVRCGECKYAEPTSIDDMIRCTVDYDYTLHLKGWFCGNGERRADE